MPEPHGQFKENPQILVAQMLRRTEERLGPETKLTADEGKAFLWEATQSTVTSHPAVGRGTDLRLTSNRLVGAALEVEDAVLHLAVFRREENDRSRSRFESPRVRRQSRPGIIIE